MQRLARGHPLLTPALQNLRIGSPYPGCPPVRNASLTSAINRGIRKSQSAVYGSRRDEAGDEDGKNVVRFHGTRSEEEKRERQRRRNSLKAETSDKGTVQDGQIFLSRLENSHREDSSRERGGRFRGLPRPLQQPQLQSNRRYRGSNQRQNGEEGSSYRPHDRPERLSNRDRALGRKPLPDGSRQERRHVRVPDSIPYTTAASEFIYGTSAVLSALRCSRRKLYKIYIYEGSGRDSDNHDETVRKAALAAGVPVKKNVVGDWSRILDKMSGGRPHNGFILEASPLPKLPTTSLESVSSTSVDSFEIQLAHQSKEEQDINGTDTQIPTLSHLISPSSTRRYPFILLLDGILDPGNLGAIIRSAYYLGVDAIAFSARNSAPFSPVTIKASAGAAENIPLLSVTNTVAFVDTSRNNGWRFFAAEAPESSSASAPLGRARHVPSFADSMALPELGNALRESPCVLMLGGEGLGLSSNLRKRTDTFVGIPRVRTMNGTRDLAGVDSLNVSVASALLIEAFLREPQALVQEIADSGTSTPSPTPSPASTSTSTVDTVATPEQDSAEQEKQLREDEPQNENRIF